MKKANSAWVAAWGDSSRPRRKITYLDNDLFQYRHGREMRCIKPGQMRHPKTGMWVTYPCGQCTPCRISKSRSWSFRNILESRHALTSSFWTLTFDELSIANMDVLGPRKMVSSFFDALRKSERRHGNMVPIRYYGCLEYGGKFGRPHFHFLIYNLLYNYSGAPSYNRGLPRPRFHIGQWPHGHVDVGQFNQATVAYTISYLMKDSRQGETLAFRTIRPAIGFYGLRHLAMSFADKPGRLPEPPGYFRIGGRGYPIDHWTRQTFDKLFRAAGGKYDHVPDPREKRERTLVLNEAYKLLPAYQEDRAEAKLRHIEYAQAQKEFEKQSQAARALQYAEKRASG